LVLHRRLAQEGSMIANTSNVIVAVSLNCL